MKEGTKPRREKVQTTVNYQPPHPYLSLQMGAMGNSETEFQKEGTMKEKVLFSTYVHYSLSPPKGHLGRISEKSVFLLGIVQRGEGGCNRNPKVFR